jgi:hypothetical protein
MVCSVLQQRGQREGKSTKDDVEANVEVLKDKIFSQPKCTQQAPMNKYTSSVLFS